jgi:hypothetical protein
VVEERQELLGADFTSGPKLEYYEEMEEISYICAGALYLIILSGQAIKLLFFKHSTVKGTCVIVR